jgi:hypothetical protein
MILRLATLFCVVFSLCWAAENPRETLERAKQLSETGFAGLQSSQPKPGQMVESALAFAEALTIYESAGQVDQAREMQAGRCRPTSSGARNG